MGVYNFAFPVLAGKEAEARKFAEEAVGAHAEHYTSLMRASVRRASPGHFNKHPLVRSFSLEVMSSFFAATVSGGAIPPPIPAV